MIRVRSIAAVLMGAICSLVAIGSTEAAENSFDWRCWQEVPVQNGGRQKPLDTLAWETLRLTGNRASLVDPETGRRLDGTAAFLVLLFDWTGWDHEQKDGLLKSTDWAPQYFYLHQADKWDKAPLLWIDHAGLKKMLGFTDATRRVAPAVVATATVIDPRTQQSLPFPTWGSKLLELQTADTPLTELEQQGLELAQRLQVYCDQRMGKTAELLPIRDGADGQWMPVGTLLLTSFDDATDPGGNLRRVQALLWRARSAYRSGDAPLFNQAGHELRSVLRELGPTFGPYPGAFKMGLELAYNHGAPFRYAWVLMLIAATSMLLYLKNRWRWSYRCAVGSYGLALLATLSGFAMRAAISGRPPVTNMYESVLYVGCGVALLGTVFEWLSRKQYTLTAAAAVSAIALILADICPAVLDPTVRPLEPVLRSNFWLVTHVLTISLSYAAFALALALANITLGYYLVRSSRDDAIRALSQFTYQAMQIGVLLLAAGIVLGGVWADYSWGRFWGWDPKEVWALVVLLGYLAVLHARLAGLVGERGLAVLSVGCFSLVVMAWYGVNFVLGIGRHSYGFGSGGQGLVYTAVLLQWLYAGYAVWRSQPNAALANPGSSKWPASAN